jgi:CO/xanthine dehydrogenase FAD-binding subunit
MKDLEYVAASTLKEALHLLGDRNRSTRVLAGGTDLLTQLRAGRFSVDRLVDVKNIPELTQLTFSTNKGLILGSAVPCYQIHENETIVRLYPGLADATSLIGGIQIQGNASVGGNLCNAAPSADTVPILIALGASCAIVGPEGERTVPVEDFCTGPGKNVLKAGELLAALHFPAPQANSGAHYLRFIPRNEMDIAVAGVGVAVVLDEAREHVKSARIGLASVAPTPVFAREASDILTGKALNEAAIQEASEAAMSAARPIDDMRGTVRQRIHLIGVLTKRALRKAGQRAQEG